MQFSYNWLQSFFDKKLPASEKLAGLLTMHSFEAKEIKKNIIFSGKRDIVLNIDILPNRAHDCFCYLGVAKEIAGLLGFKIKSFPKEKYQTINQKAEKFFSLEVKDKDLCRRYIGRAVLGVKVAPSPKWMQERLLAVGQKPINNIVDIANYVMLEMGQPLHAFDMDKLESAKIIVRRAKDGEKITSLDGKEYVLDGEMLIIADSQKPIAIAGIKGGKEPEIDEKTKNIILESANFDPVSIRLTSRKLGLRTGASVGFENEISPALAEKAMERMTALIAEFAGGKVSASAIDFYPKKIKPAQISFSSKDISKLIGVAIPEKKVSDILRKLNLPFKKKRGLFWVTAPDERLDLIQKEDVIEEITRIYGYEKIPSEAPKELVISPSRNNFYFYGEITKNAFLGAGFSETYNYSFAPSGDIEIENPISQEKKYLRINLIDGLRRSAAQNFKYFNEVKLFEIGKIFNSSERGIEEKNSLAGIIAYKNSKAEKEVFFEIKGIIEMLFADFGISDFWLNEHIFGTAGIKIGNEEVGIIGRDYFEVDFDKLIKLINDELEYRPISKYPPVTRDIAIFVPLKTKVIEVLDIIENTAGKILLDTDLFDTYEGEDMGDRKSLAFHLIFQSEEKTLSDKEVNGLMDKIIKALEANPDWEVRK